MNAEHCTGFWPPRCARCGELEHGTVACKPPPAIQCANCGTMFHTSHQCLPWPTR
jgi:hypothetical protein